MLFNTLIISRARSRRSYVIEGREEALARRSIVPSVRSARSAKFAYVNFSLVTCCGGAAWVQQNQGLAFFDIIAFIHGHLSHGTGDLRCQGDLISVDVSIVGALVIAGVKQIQARQPPAARIRISNKMAKFLVRLPGRLSEGGALFSIDITGDLN